MLSKITHPKLKNTVAFFLDVIVFVPRKFDLFLYKDVREHSFLKQAQEENEALPITG